MEHCCYVNSNIAVSPSTTVDLKRKKNIILLSNLSLEVIFFFFFFFFEK